MREGFVSLNSKYIHSIYLPISQGERGDTLKFEQLEVFLSKLDQTNASLRNEMMKSIEAAEFQR